MAPQAAEQITATPPVAGLQPFKNANRLDATVAKRTARLWVGFLFSVMLATAGVIGAIKFLESLVGPDAVSKVKGWITVSSEISLAVVILGYVALLLFAWISDTGTLKLRSLVFWYTAVVAVPFSGIVLGLAYFLFSSMSKVVDVVPEKRIAVPFTTGFDWEPYRRWIVQEDGRNKPFDSFCRETVRTICGREKFEYVSYGANKFPGHDPVAVVVSWMLLYDADRQAQGEAVKKLDCDWEHYPFILCDNQELRRILFFDLRGEPTADELHGRYVAPADLRNSVKFREMIRDGRIKRNEDSKAALPEHVAKAMEVSHRLDLYDRIREGGGQKMNGQFGVVALDKYSGIWFPIPDLRRHAADAKLWSQTMRARKAENYQSYDGKSEQEFPAKETETVLAAYADLQQAYRTGEPDKLSAASDSFFQTVEQTSKEFSPYPATETADLELWYNQKVPFQKAWIYSLLAGLLLLSSIALAKHVMLSRVLYGGGLLVFVASIAWSIGGFATRVWISGRPPVSNMYESVIFVAFMTAVFGLILELVYRQGIIALAASLVSLLGFVLADQLPLTLDPKISPLVAVLRSNYWLIIHVMTIVSSYAAFALAWGLGNLNLGLILFAPGRQDLIKTLSLFCYRAIQIGVVLLFLGTMLGGFWAAESWGRFWGWDPKEVWALIAFLCYIIPLHARYIGWVKDFGLAVCSVVCFAAVVMAWYGVNFVLAAGLHSYGFGGGDNLWVTWAAMINVDLVLCGALSFMYRRNLAAIALPA